MIEMNANLINTLYLAADLYVEIEADNITYDLDNDRLALNTDRFERLLIAKGIESKYKVIKEHSLECEVLRSEYDTIRFLAEYYLDLQRDMLIDIVKSDNDVNVAKQYINAVELYDFSKELI